MTPIERAKTMPKRSGRAEYIKFLEGHRLTRAQAIKAKCYECVGGEDTKPCTIPSCALAEFCQWNTNTLVAP